MKPLWKKWELNHYWSVSTHMYVYLLYNGMKYLDQETPKAGQHNATHLRLFEDKWAASFCVLGRCFTMQISNQGSMHALWKIVG